MLSKERVSWGSTWVDACVAIFSQKIPYVVARRSRLMLVSTPYFNNSSHTCRKNYILLSTYWLLGDVSLPCHSTILNKKSASWGSEWHMLVWLPFHKKYCILLLDKAGWCWFPLPACFSYIKCNNHWLVFFLMILVTPGLLCAYWSLPEVPLHYHSAVLKKKR